MSDRPYKKKLIEVALPLEAISEATAREKSIKVGKPTAVHHWWARRPLSACRAVLFAQLVDDPSSDPTGFPTEASQDAERQRLFAILEDLIKWENSDNEEVLEAARVEIRRSFGGEMPALHDPFAGGGSIPLEAQRLGLETTATDLNPIAVLINKALIEVPPRFRNGSAVHPSSENRTRWEGAAGLASDVLLYGEAVRSRVEEHLGSMYPRVSLVGGAEANVVSWIWARTAICPNPVCRATMPLMSSYWLSKKAGKRVWLRPVPKGDRVEFSIESGDGSPSKPPKLGRGGKFRCECCQQTAEEDYIRGEGKSGRIGAQLVAIAAEGDRRREYLVHDVAHVVAATVPRPPTSLAGSMPANPRWFSPPGYGMPDYVDLFTNRQLAALLGFVDAIRATRNEVLSDALDSGLDEASAGAYADALTLYMSLALGRLADWNNSMSRWEPNAQVPQQLFGRHAIPMVWDFSEANPLGTATGSFIASCKNISRSLLGAGTEKEGRAFQADARNVAVHAVIATDPPYYANIGYADLSDFFYIWLRPLLDQIYPELFQTLLTPKAEELISTPYRHGGSESAAERYFEDGFIEVFENARLNHPEVAPLTLFYAFKQSEIAAEGLVSTGWSTMLEGLLAAGWMVTGTWPMRTEGATRMQARGNNSLASSVVLACRPRPESAALTDRRGFLRVLEDELPSPVRDLQKAAIAPVDLRQAAIGPGMAVFSRFSKVVEPDGQGMRVRTALALINQVLEQVLGEQEAGFDPETRWAIQWFSQYFESDGPYGVAEQLAVSMNVSVEGMRKSGILESGGGSVRLLRRDELEPSWDPAVDDRVPVWEATQHLIGLLEVDGELAAGQLLVQLEGMGEACRALAYRLFDVCDSARPSLAGPYNALAASWPEIQRLAASAPQPVVAPEQQHFDT